MVYQLAQNDDLLNLTPVSLSILAWHHLSISFIIKTLSIHNDSAVDHVLINGGKL